MTATYEVDGDAVDRVRSGTVELRQSAEHGEVGGGTFVIDDTPGTQVVVGQKDVAVDESACSDPISFRGFVAERNIARGKEATGPSREITVQLEDGNARLGFRGITGSDRKRPAGETVAERGAWIMASDYLDGLVVDNGRCDFSSDKGMDAADYTDQFPGDVIADMALAQGGVNHYVRTFDDMVGPELVFRDENQQTDDTFKALTDTSTIHISNVTGEDDQDTIFYPSRDFNLTRRPDRVKSKIAYQYAKGRVVEERAQTATDFNGERFGVASNSNIKTSAKASDEARAQLWQLHTEEDVLEGSILVPATHANLLNHGDRIGVRLEHMQNLGGPGITTYYDADDWVYCRVLELIRKPKLKPVAKYELSMRLSPQEAAEPTLDFVQRTFGRASTGPLVLHFANPLTIGNKLLVIVVDTGTALPSAPKTSGPLPFFGAGAWTRLNGANRTAVRVKTVSGTSYYNGVAAYYKTIDAATQDGYLPTNYMAGGAWELPAAANLAGATVVYEDDETTAGDPCIFNAGSLGTVTTSQVAVMAAIWQNNVGGAGLETGYSGDFRPLTAVAPGSFTERHYAGSYDSNYGPYPAAYPAITWIGDMEGAGAAASASIQKPRNERFGFDFGTVGWAAIGIKVGI